MKRGGTEEITSSNDLGTISTDRSGDLVVDLVGERGGEREPAASVREKKNRGRRKKMGRAGRAGAAKLKWTCGALATGATL
jgi:hypothetical protein